MSLFYTYLISHYFMASELRQGRCHRSDCKHGVQRRK